MTDEHSSSSSRKRSDYLHIDAQDAAVLDALAEHMSKIRQALRTFGRTEPRWAIGAESQAAVERGLLRRQYGPGGDWNDHAVDYAADAGLLFLLVQADHLAVLHRIYDSYEGLMFGAFPPARSLLELQGYVFWLLHPDVADIRLRAARALHSELNNARRDLAAARQLNAPAETRRPRGERLSHLKKRVESEFYPSEITYEAKTGQLILRGESHPGPGAALRYLEVAGNETSNSSGAYAFLSNATHPTLHVITDTILFNDDGSPGYFGHDDTEFHCRLARLAMIGLLKTWHLVALYRGLDVAVPLKLLKEVDSLPVSGRSCSPPAS